MYVLEESKKIDDNGLVDGGRGAIVILVVFIVLVFAVVIGVIESPHCGLIPRPYSIG